MIRFRESDGQRSQDDFFISKTVALNDGVKDTHFVPCSGKIYNFLNFIILSLLL